MYDLEFKPVKNRAPAVRRKTAKAPSPAGHSRRLALLLAAVCAFSLLFAYEVTRPAPGDALAVFRSASDNGDDGPGFGDEQLGRLRLVRLPGLLTVFAPSDAPILPVASPLRYSGDDMTAGIYAPEGSEVFSVLPGTVKNVVTGELPSGGSAGGIVTISHEGGVEISYYGLADIRVERGQPVLQRTVLGVLRGSVLYIRVTRNGRPVDPLDFLGVNARLG